MTGKDGIRLPDGAEPVRLDDPDWEEKATLQWFIYGQVWYAPPRRDEFDAYLEKALLEPSFRAAYQAAQARHDAGNPLAVNGREYRRRQLARRRRR